MFLHKFFSARYYEKFIMPGSEREGITLGLANLSHLLAKTPEQWC